MSDGTPQTAAGDSAIYIGVIVGVGVVGCCFFVYCLRSYLDSSKKQDDEERRARQALLATRQAKKQAAPRTSTPPPTYYYAPPPSYVYPPPGYPQELNNPVGQAPPFSAAGPAPAAPGATIVGSGNAAPAAEAATVQRFEINVGIDKYKETDLKFGETIGKGGGGVVYRVTVVATGETMALKVFRTANNAELDATSIVNEIRNLRELNSEYCLRLLAMVEGEGGARMQVHEFGILTPVMSYDLASAIQRNTPAQTTHALVCAARGLAYLHMKNIIHADLKPSNILIDASNGRAVLADFGLSGVTALKGLTLEYAAPELFTARKQSLASDMFAFACTIVEALGCTRPYSYLILPRPDDERRRFIRDACVSGRGPFVRDPLLPSQCCAALVTATSRCLEADPAARPTIREVRESLEAEEATRSM